MSEAGEKSSQGGSLESNQSTPSTGMERAKEIQEMMRVAQGSPVIKENFSGEEPLPSDTQQALAKHDKSALTNAIKELRRLRNKSSDSEE